LPLDDTVLPESAMLAAGFTGLPKTYQNTPLL